jgi:negative regulator of flagellin synthesis FlgM
MKIGQTPELHAAALQAVATASKQAAKTTGPAAEEAAKGAQVATSSVSFSNSAKELAPAGRATSEFDAGRVKAMREAIANGTFSTNAEAIADKLLANAGEFIVHSSAARVA